MQGAPKVSVIVPVHNTEQYLRQCLDSIVNQTLQEIEIICVDDGSTDGSLDILREYESRDSRVIVLKQEHKNAGAARNCGMSAAHGAYLSFLDADDFFEPEMLQAAYNEAIRCKAEIVVYRCDRYHEISKTFESVDWSIESQYLPNHRPFAGKDILHNTFRAFVGWPWDKLFSAAFVRENGLQFQEQRTTNDMLFVFSAIVKAKRISTLEQVFAHQRRRPNESLSVTREQSWDCFYHALIALKEQLQAWGLYNHFRKDYINYALYFSLWHISTLVWPTQEVLYNKLKDSWFEELGITPQLNAKYFYERGDYEKYLQIMNQAYDQMYPRVDQAGTLLDKNGDAVTPRVTIVMPSLNVAEYMRECIKSVIKQTEPRMEILCIDAGSTDGTLGILEEYASQDRRIRIIHSDRKSYGYQVNLGLKAARGEYFGIVETDDCIPSNMYKTLCDLCDEHRLDVIKADYREFAGEGRARVFDYHKILREEKYYNKVLDSSADPEVFRATRVYSWAGVYRTSFLWENNILHNETPGASYQDNGFWFQVFTQAHRVMFYDKPFYMLRRDNPNSSIKSPAKVYCMCEEYDFIRSFLHSKPELEARFATLCAYFRNDNYMGTLRRIAPEFKQEFLHRYAEDFRALDEAGELDPALFQDLQWARLRLIMTEPDAWYYSRCYRTGDAEIDEILLSDDQITECVKRLRKKSAFQQSTAYQVGKKLMWLPRKTRGFFQCIRDHGLVYTIKYASTKFMFLF